MITKGERGAGVFERGGWGWFGAGEMLLAMSEATEKVPTKNETATDFRL